MAKDKNIVHQYFKKELGDATIMLRVNPIHFTGLELTIDKKGNVNERTIELDEQIFDDLKHDEFVEANALEFNIYLSGLK